MYVHCTRAQFSFLMHGSTKSENVLAVRLGSDIKFCLHTFRSFSVFEKCPPPSPKHNHYYDSLCLSRIFIGEESAQEAVDLLTTNARNLRSIVEAVLKDADRAIIKVPPSDLLERLALKRMFRLILVT